MWGAHTYGGQLVYTHNRFPPGHRRSLGLSQRAVRTRVVTRRFGFSVGGSRRRKTAAKSPCKHSPRVARQPSHSAQRRAPQSTHTGYSAGSTPKCAGSEPSACCLAAPVRFSFKPAPRPATCRHKHRGHPSDLRQASDTHQQRLANGQCTKVAAFHAKCATPAPRRLAPRARKLAAEDNARRRRAEGHERRRSIIGATLLSYPVRVKLPAPASHTAYLRGSRVSGLDAPGCSSRGATGR